MAERGEKYVPKNLIADIEKGKWWIKRITTQMESLAETMDSCPEEAVQYKLLGEELSKIKITISNKEKIVQLFKERD